MKLNWKHIAIALCALFGSTLILASCSKDKLEVKPIAVSAVPPPVGYTGCQTKSFLIDVDSAWNDPLFQGRMISLCDCDTLRIELTNLPGGQFFTDWVIFDMTNIHWSTDMVIDTITADKYLTAFIEDGGSGWNVDLVVDFESCD